MVIYEEVMSSSFSMVVDVRTLKGNVLRSPNSTHSFVLKYACKRLDENNKKER